MANSSIHVASAPKLSEAQRRQVMFSPASIAHAVDYDCTPSKDSYPCPNHGRCKDFKTRSEGPHTILKLRRQIWLHCERDQDKPTLSKRKKNFVDHLVSMGLTKENRIAFCIDGVYVCKSYFKVACGIPTKSFDAAVAYVENRTSNKGALVYSGGHQATSGSSKCKDMKSHRLSTTLHFLDAFFRCKYMFRKL